MNNSLITLKQSWWDKILWRGGKYMLKAHISPENICDMDVSDWLNENIKNHHFEYHKLFDSCIIKLKTKEDAVAFKLRWM